MSDERQIEQILHQIESLQHQIDQLATTAASTSEGGTIIASHDPRLDEIARSELRRFDLRDQFFPSEQFGEASWHIILDLFVQEQQQKKVSVTSACIASRKPPTTGLRWIQYLESIGYIERENDPDDSRKAYLRLTEKCRHKLLGYLAKAQALH